jgi:transcription termination factor Rho
MIDAISKSVLTYLLTYAKERFSIVFDRFWNNFPAIDLLKSGTRKEELLVDKTELTKVFVLRRILNPMGTTDAIEFLLSKLKQTKTNSEFFDSMNN